MTLTKIVIIMGFERSQAILAILISLLIIPGCTAPSKIVENEMPDTGVIVPERLNLIASTPGRDYDRMEVFDILADANGENTLILWVSTGCPGCHDWTEMIADSMRSGNLSNDTRIISVHRFPAFESPEYVIEIYASENSSTNSLWPVLIPSGEQPAIDVANGELTDYEYWQAFGNPSAPSFTILDGEGFTIWENKNYWANHTVFDEALEILNS